ncbi:uncharacterized protein M421DRAFT_62411 [Didymella exigua CBS 183.55]|uniref:Uncharacterized protein n=1 Tax=Didymella exigua CBS 183.55 TaxID=1150837 RepID=A0A6A5RL77_9PLEO|nr:uncharacterized protein M421DRAFT_62411 [Didymella exigua CBS 183.55]KAF1928552.1 hypothetical protein M421DRAFT_62411 [Didymella exigua CBS 183.55]
MQPRNRDAFKTPNLSKPPSKVVAVSTTTVFKKQKLDRPQLQCTSRSPQRSTVRKTRRKTHVEEVHPLALAFRETSEEYRRHLFANAATKIDEDLEMLLNKLYERNLQDASSNPANNDSHGSPLMLTIPAQYQRLVQKLCNPLSGHRYSLQRANSLGEMEDVQITVHDRFQSFEENVQAETKVIKNLQRQWEGVVAEIFSLGVACLGEDTIATVLSTAEPDADDAEPTLFVPEHKSSANKGKAKMKRVSFAGPDMANLFPVFLLQTSEQQKLIPATRNLPIEEFRQLEQAIADMGKQHIADLQRLEREHQAWWKKKQIQLQHTFMQD